MSSCLKLPVDHTAEEQADKEAWDPVVRRCLVFGNDIGVSFGSAATMRVTDSTISRNNGNALLVSANDVSEDSIVQRSNLHENSLDIRCPGPGPRRMCQGAFHGWARGTLKAPDNYWGDDRRQITDDPFGFPRWNTTYTGIRCADSADPVVRLSFNCECERSCGPALHGSLDKADPAHTPFPLMPMQGLAADADWKDAWDVLDEKVSRAFSL